MEFSFKLEVMSSSYKLELACHLPIGLNAHIREYPHKILVEKVC